MKPLIRKLPLIAALIVPVASANTVFSDNFDANTLGLNAVPSGWSVSGGTVDIIGTDTSNNQSYDLLPGNGIYIDLDGSTLQAGLLSIDLNLDANVAYTASFSLAGNQRGGAADTVVINFGGSSVTVLEDQIFQSFTTYFLGFTPSVSGIYALSFQNEGGDNVGALLDNVTVTAAPVPLPAAAWLLGPALLGLGRRKSKSLDV